MAKKRTYKTTTTTRTKQEQEERTILPQKEKDLQLARNLLYT